MIVACSPESQLIFAIDRSPKTMIRFNLVDFHASSCSWRVRIALHVKGIEYTRRSIDVRSRAREQDEAGYGRVNPMRQVPVLEWSHLGRTRRLSQSLAIIHYLEGEYPGPALIPADGWQAARTLQFAELINAGVQPLQNAGVLREIDTLGGCSGDWARAWTAKGLAAYEGLLEESAPPGPFSCGATVTVADLCLVPQVFNASRNAVDLEPLPRVRAIYERCMAMPAFSDTQPACES